MTWRVIVAPIALEILRKVKDARERNLLTKRISALAQDPDKQGKPLGGELAGFRSVRAVGQRWRILYQLQGDQVLVTIVFLGRRKQGDKRDVYELARKLLKSGLYP